jgi:hypothetical protein
MLIPTKRFELGYRSQNKNLNLKPPILTLENKTDILTTLFRTTSSGSNS